MRVHLTAFDDRTFKYSIAAPSATWYLKRVTGLAKGATSPGKEVVGNVSLRALYEIAMSKKKVGACGGEVVVVFCVRSTLHLTCTLIPTPHPTSSLTPRPPSWEKRASSSASSARRGGWGSRSSPEAGGGWCRRRR